MTTGGYLPPPACCWLIRSVADEVDSARVATVDLAPDELVADSAASRMPPAFEGDVMLMDGTGDERRHDDVSEDAVAVLMAVLWLVDRPLPLLSTGGSPFVVVVLGGGVAGSSITVVIGPFVVVLAVVVTSLLPGQRSLFLSSSLACSNENFFSMIAEKDNDHVAIGQFWFQLVVSSCSYRFQEPIFRQIARPKVGSPMALGP